MCTEIDRCYNLSTLVTMSQQQRIDGIGERKRNMYSGLTTEQESKHQEVDEGQSRGRGLQGAGLQDVCVGNPVCKDVHGRDGGHLEARGSLTSLGRS